MLKILINFNILTLLSGVCNLAEIDLKRTVPKNAVAYYPMPKLNNMKIATPSNFFDENSRRIQQVIQLYKKGASEDSMNPTEWTSLLGYKPIPNIKPLNINVTRKYQKQPPQYMNEDDAKWHKFLKDSYLDVIQNRYFFLPSRREFNTTVAKPVKIDIFRDIFDRKLESVAEK